MNKVLWISGLGITLLLGSCGGEQAQQPAGEAASNAQPIAQAPVAQTFPKPTIVSANAPMQTVSVKGLLQPTSPQARLSQISTTTRRDPFATLLPSNLKVATPTQPEARVNRSGTARSQTAQQPLTQPITPVPQLPLKPLPPLPVSSTPLTPTSLPALPPVSQTSLADAVEITGVMQVGGKVTAIVQSPNEATARYVQAGDYLANGSVLLKRIILSKNGEPTIVLQQNGIEVTKSLGSTRGPIASTL